MNHKPVMLEECLTALNIKPDGIYIDGTFGRGGHSQAILAKLGPDGQLFCIDKDPEAIESGRALLGDDERVHFHHGCFSEMAEVVARAGLMGKVDGILLDFGVSSPQLDNPERGFSFQQDGPLDMRMDYSRSPSAAEWINQASIAEMITVFRKYGEEPFAKKIAFQIDQTRQETPIETTWQLASLIDRTKPYTGRRHHPATQVFQAIRLKVNQELEAIEQVLAEFTPLLAQQGRFVAMSFHSLEDRLVKQRFRQLSTAQVPKAVRAFVEPTVPDFDWVMKKQRASDEECQLNARARSATLRVVEKCH